MDRDKATEIADTIESYIDAKIREYHDNSHVDNGASGGFYTSYAEKEQLIKVLIDEKR